MLRRRLVLSSSSEEDEEPQNQPLRQRHQQDEEAQHRQSQPQPPPILPHSRDSMNPYPTTANPSAEPLEISDDEDFISVSDNLSPPSPPNPHPAPPPPQPPSRPLSPIGCPISEFFRGIGLGLKREWLGSCVRRLEQALPGFGGLGVDSKAKLCFEKFLVSDMNRSGGGVFPVNVDRLHLVDLPGPFVLQVDEIVNISNPVKGRYQKAAPGIKRCLKLSMTDGVQRVFGMEYRPIRDLDALAPAGLKVVICNVHVRHGLLMLVPEAFEVLGGVVEELEAARKRLVDEVNKPPRGIRTRGGVIPPLGTRATLAAWPSNGVHVAGNTNNVTSEHTTSFPVHSHGATYAACNTDSGQRIGREFPGVVSEESGIRNPSANVVMDVDELPIPVSAESAIPNVSPEVLMGAVEETYIAVSMEEEEEEEEVHVESIQNRRANFVSNSSSDVASIVEEIDMDTTPCRTENPVSDPHLDDILNDKDILVADEVEHPLSSRANVVSNSSSDVASIGEEIDMITIPRRTASPVSDPYSNDVLNDEEILVADEVEHPLILSGNREVPFTYLASLSAKWTAMKRSARSVKGIVKCFLTGVKGFQYRERRIYELQVYVDDGSFISEISIHHDAVQKAVDHSPQEVMAAISSSDQTTVNNIRATMRQFQSFLINFEGKMLIEINEESPFPVALEMSQGCSESDARLLLRRLKSSVPAQT
ncbi:hypothetical protein TIFTF001_025700 [Ficus carica]|uniref:RecQ-mediated genome instability protein 1 n=1 Tax=Ficus carica TaxID=3494 RepID=A0AA88DKL8_FICCA|nr:hypothetical protein TIFTF001_025700 [Ficus carica]